MTKEQLNQWITMAKLVDCKREYDESSNCEETRIYSAEGKFYQLEFQNGYPDETWGEKGFVRGVYAEPREVIRETKMVEVVVYRDKDPTLEAEEYFSCS